MQLHRVRELEQEKDNIIFKERIKLARNQSKEEGKIEEKRKIAKAMLQDGDPIEKIVRITGLPESDIQQLS